MSLNTIFSKDPHDKQSWKFKVVQSTYSEKLGGEKKTKKNHPTLMCLCLLSFSLLLAACLMVIYNSLVPLGNGERKTKFKNCIYYLLETLIKFLVRQINTVKNWSNYLSVYGRLNDGLQRYSYPNSWNLWMLFYMAKWTLQLWLRILRWVDYLELSREAPNVITSVLRKGAQAKEYRWKLKRQQNRLPSVSRRNEPWWHLDFSPMKMISDFWSPEL